MRRFLNTTALAVLLGGTAFALPAYAASDSSYCDAKWVKADANSDGAITQEEANAEVAAEFGAIDADASGAIDKTEYLDCMNKGSDMMSAEATRDAGSMKQADANADGSVDKNEFRTASEKAYKDSRSATDANAEPVVVFRRFVWLVPNEAGDAFKDMSQDEAASRSAMTFARLDQNGDDTLSEDEWTTKTTKLSMPSAVADANFAKLDADSDGELTQKEYVASSMAMVTDNMKTSSTEQDSSAQAAGSSDTAAIPVYVYRFSRM